VALTLASATRHSAWEVFWFTSSPSVGRLLLCRGIRLRIASLGDPGPRRPRPPGADQTRWPGVGRKTRSGLSGATFAAFPDWTPRCQRFSTSAVPYPWPRSSSEGGFDSAPSARCPLAPRVGPRDLLGEPHPGPAVGVASPTPARLCRHQPALHLSRIVLQPFSPLRTFGRGIRLYLQTLSSSGCVSPHLSAASVSPMSSRFSHVHGLRRGTHARDQI